MHPATRHTLLTDFDGTLTRHDYYQLVRDQLIPVETTDYWTEYRAGRMTHFEALAAYFAAARPDESALLRLVDQTGLDEHLAEDIAALRAAGWRVVVVSAGCRWYIDRLLAAAGVQLEVHSNPGRVVDGRLSMNLDRSSPFFGIENGIDKAAVMRAVVAESDLVAFAGDGPPDLAPALMVPAERRFATGFLADELDRQGAPYRRFGRWHEVAAAILTGAGA